MEIDDTNKADKPGSSAIQAALAKVLKSAPLQRSPTQSTFLRYVVEQTLAGKSARIKAYNIATEALERDGGFDPANDPIVRVEAMRLRRALAAYYRDEGQSEPVIISLPKGRYVPYFTWNAAAKPVAAPAPSSVLLQTVPANQASRTAPSVELASETLTPLSAAQGGLALALRTTLIDAVGRFGFIRWAGSARCDPALIMPDLTSADFVIRMFFSAGESSNALSYTYQVWERDGQTIIWQGVDHISAQATIAAAISRLCGAVLSHAGCIHRHNLAQMLSGKTFDAQYECKLHYLNVVHTYGDPVREAEVRMRIEAHLQRDYGFAYGYSFLAHLLYRQSLGHPHGHTLDHLLLRAWHLALRGTELCPGSSYCHAKLYWLSDMRGETKIAQAALETALKLNPYDDQLVIAQGAQLICNGDAQAGVALMEQRFFPEVSCAVDFLFYIALGKFLVDDIEGAEEYGLRIPADLVTRTQSHPGAFLLRALFAAARGDTAQAKAAALVMDQSFLAAHHDITTFLARFIRHKPSIARIENTIRTATAPAEGPATPPYSKKPQATVPAQPKTPSPTDPHILREIK